jgi:hypothetical protein
MKRSTIEKFRWWMLRSQRIPLVADIYRSISQFVMWRVGRRVGAVPGVAAIYSRHTHPRSRTFVAGHSDLDLTVVLEDEAADDAGCIQRCSAVLKQMGRRYLFVKPEDARFMSQGELCRLSTDFCSSFELPYRPEGWLLIAGRDVRPRSRPLPTRFLVMHPEFNKWWENIIQAQFFRPTIELRNGFMRSLYRSVVKNQVHLETARGLHPEEPEGFVSDELSNLAFKESPALLKILSELKRDGLWSNRPEEVAHEILFEVLRGTERFFLDLPGSASSQRACSIRKRNRTEPDTHFFDALVKRISENQQITSVLESAVVYSFPQAHPYTYRLDLVLHEGLSEEQLATACQTMKNSWGQKNFDVAGFPVEFNLIPAGIYRSPLFFLGMPYVFLLEHIREFGQVVYGSSEICLPSPWSRDDLLQWCRMFMPYHMMTFRRRLEYGSPVLNFCQLASLQIFIERDRRLTDAVEVRRVYMEEFMNGSDEDVVDYLFRYPYERSNPALYDRATSYVAQTYAMLESQLKRHDRTMMHTLP